MSFRAILFGLALGVPAIAAVTPKNIQTPVMFSENRGQYPEGALYGATGRGYSFGIQRDRATLRLNSGASAGAVTMRLVGAQSSATVQAGTPAGGYQNVFIGNDPAKWAKGLPFYANVRVNGVYSGIDVNYHGSPADLEYDFIVGPGADPGQIRLSFDGASGVRLTSDGSLELTLPGGKLVNKRPVLYQVVAGRRVEVEGKFWRDQSGFAFAVAAYRRDLDLVIDPVLAYSTYIGPQGHSDPHIIVDGGGSIYLATSACPTLASSLWYTAPNANCPGVVHKLNSSGTKILYSSVFGNDVRISGLAVDPSGVAYVVGTASYTGFPVFGASYRKTAQSDPSGFAAEFSNTGNLVAATFLDGTFTKPLGLAIDSAGNFIIVGFAASDLVTKAAQPTASAGYAGFVMKLNSTADAMIFATNLGTSGGETVRAVTVDRTGNIYVTGTGATETFPTTVGAYKRGTASTRSGFVTKYTPAGAVVYSSLLNDGSAASSLPNAIVCDESGNAIIAGAAKGPFLDAALAPQASYAGGATDAFVMKLNSSGSDAVWGTYLGGSDGDDEALALALDSANRVFISGRTTSSDLKTINASYSKRPGDLDSLYRSIDGGATWTSLHVNFNSAPRALLSGKSGSKTVLYAEVDNKLFTSVDKGSTWTRVACQSGPVVPVSTSLANASYVYWASGSSRDGGATCFSNPYVNEVYAITADPISPAIAYMATAAHGVLKTVDGGQSWSSWPINLPPGFGLYPVDLIAVSPVDSKIIYISGEHVGFFISSDGGQNWTLGGGGILGLGSRARIIPDQTNANGAYYISSAIYRTIDRGVTWRGPIGPAGYDTAVDIANGNTLYQAGFSGLLKSLDAGGTFTSSSAGISNANSVTRVATDPFDHNTVYASTQVTSKGFISALGESGALLYSSYFGGSSLDSITSLAIGQDNAIYFAGLTYSSDLPVTAGVIQTSLSDLPTVFVAKLDLDVRITDVQPWNLPASGVTSFVFSNPGGIAKVSSLEINVNGQNGSTANTANGCYIRYLAASNALQLWLESNSWSPDVVPGSAAVVSNTKCTLRGTGSSIVSAGGNLTLNLNLSFVPEFDSYHPVFVRSTDASGLSAPWQTSAFYVRQSLQPLRFVPMTPCRVADTRNAPGPFGGPFIAGGTSRDFRVPRSSCVTGPLARAYSLNVTVIPRGSLGYLTVWPYQDPRPFVSNLNSLDGRIKANAVIAPEGVNDTISVFADRDTDVVIDINGYFADLLDTDGLSFYPLPPCRVADTRNAAGALGGPMIPRQGTRTLPVASTCGVPADARAYSLNFTAVPLNTLPYLTAWPTGSAKPFVSTLNALLPNQIVANAAIVPAGTNGDISVYAEDATHLIVDINGYFAPSGSPGALSYYTVSPCRVADTRLGPWAPALKGSRPFQMITNCGLSSSAAAYVVNATVVPTGSLGYLSLWPDGAVQPYVSTLNALDGAITSNAAIVPTTNGNISAFTTSTSEVILDVSGYFAP